MPRQFFAMIRVELLKVFTRFSGLGAIVMAAVIPLVTIGVLHLLGGTSTSTNVQGQVSQSFLTFDVVSAVGWSLWARNFILLPLMFMLATGASVAGEQSERTLRELVVRPVPRWSILAAKQIALWGLSLVTLVVGLGVTLGVGWAVFGPPAMDQTVADPNESLLRAVLGFAVSFTSDVALIALGTLVSTFVSSVGGVVMSLAVVLLVDRAVWALLWALSSRMFQVGWAGTLIEYTLTNMLGASDHWKDAFLPSQFAECALLVIVAWALAVARFSRTDVP